MVKNSIKKFSEIFSEKIKNKKIHLVSHFDTDGITSAAILSKALEKLDIQFSLKILKQLTIEEIEKFPKDKIILLSDLGSGSLDNLSKLESDIFIIDHHEVTGTIGNNIHLLNPHFQNQSEDLCSAEISYLFSKCLSEENKILAHLAIVGMVGDTMEKEISKLRNEIINDAEVNIKKGLLLYPSTRPIDRTLEYSSRPYIPGVTGNSKGTFDLLREAGIEKTEKSYKALIDLDVDEMKRLATAVTLRLSAKESSELIGNLYLIKFFNKIEDARELSAIINACSRMDKPETALLLCLGNSIARKKAERIYISYRQHIISGLKYIDQNNKIEGREYVIINAKDQIKDTIIGTLASILSFSQVYKEGTIIITMAYNNDKIKVSARLCGRNGKSPRNLKDLMDSVTGSLGGESGGHKEAAGCIIDKKDEENFIKLVKSKLEYELVKV